MYTSILTKFKSIIHRGKANPIVKYWFSGFSPVRFYSAVVNSHKRVSDILYENMSNETCCLFFISIKGNLFKIRTSIRVPVFDKSRGHI